MKLASVEAAHVEPTGVALVSVEGGEGPAPGASAAAQDLPGSGRAVCARCGRPLVVCYCAHIPRLTTRTRVLLLQHPRERHVAIGTARMAHLALAGSAFRRGVDFSDDPVVRAAVAETPLPYVLFPGPGAEDVARLPRDRAISLIVLDGTWSQARKLLTRNPALAALPRVAFTPRRPSAYRIRRQPAAFCVSTIEALAEVLEQLEPEGAGMERLLDPFHAMVAFQERFATEVAAGRHRRPPSSGATDGQSDAAADADDAGPARASREASRLAAALEARRADLVCIYGEANAWPKRMRDRPAPEIVRWMALRPATGESFEAIVAPRRPLAPAVPERIGVPAAALREGISVAAWHRAWAAFCRPTDALVIWGGFEVGLAAAEGLPLPAEMFDLRRESHRLFPLLFPRLFLARPRAVEEALHIVAPAGELPALGTGRGGVRLCALARLLDAFTAPSFRPDA